MRLPTAFVLNPVAARNARFGCLVCQWRSSVGITAIGEGLAHAAIHENPVNGAGLQQVSAWIETIQAAGVDMEFVLSGCILSKQGEEGWNSSVFEQMEDAGVLVRVRGMG